MKATMLCHSSTTTRSAGFVVHLISDSDSQVAHPADGEKIVPLGMLDIYVTGTQSEAFFAVGGLYVLEFTRAPE